MGSIKSLESNVAKERAFFRTQIQKLKAENAALSAKVRQLTESAGRKPGDGSAALRRYNHPSSTRTNYTDRRRSRSRSSSISSHVKTSRSSLSPGSLLSTNIHECHKILFILYYRINNYRQLDGVN